MADGAEQQIGAADQVVDDPTAGMVPPQPVPMTWTVDRVQTDAGTPVVLIRVYDPTGVKVYFLDPDFARQIGNNIVGATGGIEVPKPGLGIIPPPPGS